MLSHVSLVYAAHFSGSYDRNYKNFLFDQQYDILKCLNIIKIIIISKYIFSLSQIFLAQLRKLLCSRAECFECCWQFKNIMHPVSDNSLLMSCYKSKFIHLKSKFIYFKIITAFVILYRKIFSKVKRKTYRRTRMHMQSCKVSRYFYTSIFVLEILIYLIGKLCD